MTPNRINMPKLINLSLEPVSTWLKRKYLLAQIKKEYMHLDYYRDQAKHAGKGQTDTSKRIVNLETALRDL